MAWRNQPPPGYLEPVGTRIGFLLSELYDALYNYNSKNKVQRCIYSVISEYYSIKISIVYRMRQQKKVIFEHTIDLKMLSSCTQADIFKLVNTIATNVKNNLPEVYKIELCV